MRNGIIILIIIATLIAVYVRIHTSNAPTTNVASSTPRASSPIHTATISPIHLAPETFVSPISNAKSRITKKPFALYVSPGHSPITPEKFTGYHTGVDFEATQDEANNNIAVYAICSGSLSEKKSATGYGGVVVERCEFEGESITIVYGHIKLDSVTLKAGDSITAGQQLAILGKGYSSETDGERKHLHLGIHRGSALDIRGYVQAKAELSQWLNIANYLK